MTIKCLLYHAFGMTWEKTNFYGCGPGAFHFYFCPGPSIFTLRWALVLETLLGRPHFGYFPVRWVPSVHPKAWATIAHTTPRPHPKEANALTIRPHSRMFNSFAVVFFREKTKLTKNALHRFNTVRPHCNHSKEIIVIIHN